MKKFKLSLLILIIIIVLFSSTAVADDYIEESADFITVNTDVSDFTFQILSRHVAVYERKSKTFLFEKASDEKCPMASTTKIMTCTIILENCNLSDTVTVSQKAASTGGSRLGLSVDAKITVNDLIYGLMLCSGNDAAVALAEYCSGSIEEFSNLMNAKAQELGLNSTHFVTPHGLDNSEHYSTAHDFAILTDYALNNPQFVQIVGTKSFDVTINGNIKQIHNTNELLGNIPSVYGVKTGYTSQAGRCLITAAKNDTIDIIVIVFGADTKNIRTNDSANLINYMLANYTCINVKNLILEKYNEYLTYIVPYIKIDKVSENIQPKLDENFPEYCLVKSDYNNPQVSLEDYKLSAPMQENQPIAQISITVNNQTVCTANILSSTAINKTTAIQYITYFFVNYKKFYVVY